MCSSSRGSSARAGTRRSCRRTSSSTSPCTSSRARRRCSSSSSPITWRGSRRSMTPTSATSRIGSGRRTSRSGRRPDYARKAPPSPRPSPSPRERESVRYPRPRRGRGQGEGERSTCDSPSCIRRASSRPGSVLVGASIKRKEDARLVAGRGRYVDDIVLPGMLHLGLVRSPHAHARILEIHRDGARRADGVVAVWTVEDLPELAAASVPPLVPEPRGRPYRHPVLAANRVRHAGEAIAVVVAENPYRLADALERVIVEYGPLPAAATPGAAVGSSAPRVHDEWADNLAALSAAETGTV